MLKALFSKSYDIAQELLELLRKHKNIVAGHRIVLFQLSNDKMTTKAEEIPSTGQTTGNTTPQKEQSINLEKGSSQNLAAPEDGATLTDEFVRPITGRSWALVCTGLFLGALLYGKS